MQKFLGLGLCSLVFGSVASAGVFTFTGDGEFNNITNTTINSAPAAPSTSTLDFAATPTLNVDLGTSFILMNVGDMSGFIPISTLSISEEDATISVAEAGLAASFILSLQLTDNLANVGDFGVIPTISADSGPLVDALVDVTVSFVGATAPFGSIFFPGTGLVGVQFFPNNTGIDVAAELDNATSQTIYAKFTLLEADTVPEPATMGLLGGGLMAIGLLSRRRRRK